MTPGMDESQETHIGSETTKAVQTTQWRARSEKILDQREEAARATCREYDDWLNNNPESTPRSRLAQFIGIEPNSLVHSELSSVKHSEFHGVLLDSRGFRKIEMRERAGRF